MVQEHSFEKLKEKISKYEFAKLRHTFFGILHGIGATTTAIVTGITGGTTSIITVPAICISTSASIDHFYMSNEYDKKLAYLLCEEQD